MMIFDNPAFDGHEAVHFVHHAESGLRAIIAVHSTALGPALGGCRMWCYASEQDALRDVLRLSRGMSYKNALADLPLGGGKAVILGDARRDKSPELLTAFGAFVDSLGGRYVTAEDIGLTEADMALIAQSTAHVSGLPKQGDSAAAGGNPAPKTAHGVFCGMAAAVRHRLQRNSLDGIRVAVQGLGSVGYLLCRELHAAGASLITADINAERVEQARDEFGADAVTVDEILAADADVLAPCALGGILNADSIARLNVSIVAGAANNQLDSDADGQRLQQRGILYAPDYVLNAGGIISAGGEYLGSLSEDAVWRRIEGLGDTLAGIFRQAERSGQPTNVVADKLALARLANKADGSRAVA